MSPNKPKSLDSGKSPGRRGFLLGLSAGASTVAAVAVVSPANAGQTLIKTASPVGTGVSAGNLSEHARKYYRSTTI
jgi:hypothetical protein